ncbi:MAG: alkaline phosphatase PhoX [Cyanobacteriota bacterium]|nr:alkaline phosphatase PhoX [Cyanobacteriota bacterium]
MATPSNLWLAVLYQAAARRSAAEEPMSLTARLARLNLSLSERAPGVFVEELQTEISTVVVVGGQRFTLSSGGGATMQVVRSTHPAATGPSLEQRLSYGPSPNAVPRDSQPWVSQAVASFGSLVAVALAPRDYSTSGGRGLVRFYRMGADGHLTALRDVEVGYMPDGLAFNSTGTMLVVANEGEPTNDYQINGVSVDRPGTIGLIAIGGTAGKETFTYSELGFDGVALPSGVRISGKSGLSTQATDIEPESVTVLGRHAYVTLQENNAVAKVNLATRAIERVFALGAVDFSSQLVDISDQDGVNNSRLIKPVLGNTVSGLRMPDGIAAFTLLPEGGFARGKDYFLTANEGDGREWGSFSDEVRRHTGLSSRLKTLADDATAPYTAFGSRGISLFDADSGSLVWDSGTTLQSVAIAAGVYDDSRSDDKGVEPEGIAVALVNGRTYAIAGLERTTRSMLVVFDVTTPATPSLVTTVVLPDSLSPEGLTVVEANRSATGSPQLVVSNEVSNTLDYLDLPTLINSVGIGMAGSFAMPMLKDWAGGSTLRITALITNGEVTNGLAPGSSAYAAPGIFDGMGAYDNGDGTITLLVNHELGANDGYQMTTQGLNANVNGARISRFVIAKDIDGNAANGLQARVLSGGLAYNEVRSSDPGFARGGFSRFCSANLSDPFQFGGGRGFVDRLYLVGEESGSGRFFALDTANGELHHLPALGRGGWESAVAVNTGSANTVALMLFDDTSGTANYLYLWVGTKDPSSSDLLRRNGLATSSGGLYAWKAETINTPTGLAAIPLNSSVSGPWEWLGSGDQIAALPTAAALRALAQGRGAMEFIRIEDGDVDPVSGQQVAFNTTGGSAGDLYGNTNVIDLSSAFTADGVLRTTPGTSSLRVIVDGDRVTGVARQEGVRNPDNIAWGRNGKVYIQEDRSLLGGTADGRFGSQEASIWEVDPLTGITNRWAQIDRSAVPVAYGQSDSLPADIGNWESSGVIEVSHLFGAPAGSVFLTNVQAHSLTNGSLNGPSYLVEGGQIQLIQVMP